MKMAKIMGPRNVKIVDSPEPVIMNDDDVKIKIAYSGICADDMPGFLQDMNLLAWPMLSNIVGHEMSGVVVETGKSAARSGYKPGDHVSGVPWLFCDKCYYCRNGQQNHCVNVKSTQGTIAEYIVLKDTQIWKLGKSISLEEGIFADPVSYCLHGVDTANITVPSKVMVIGASILGLLIMQIVKIMGATSVTIVESSEIHRKVALDTGADYVLDPRDLGFYSKIFSISENYGFDTVFETSANPANLTLALNVLARKGKILYSNLYGLESQCPLNLLEMYTKEASLLPFYLPPYMLPRAIKLMEKLNLKPLISKVFEMDEVQQAFDAFETGMYPKIIIRC